MKPTSRDFANVHWLEHQAMACDWGVGVRDVDAGKARSAAQAAFDEIDRLETELSRFRTDSDITRLNRLRPGESLTVGPAMMDCLAIAARVHGATGGAFDIGVGALVPGRGQPNSLEKTQKRSVGMRCLRVDAEARQVQVSTAGVIFDLGAIGKGYAADCAVEILQEWGVSAAIVHAGQSSIRAFGDCDWPVAVRDPRDEAQRIAELVLKNESLGGSGLRTRGAHIIDPRTGQSVTDVAGAWARAGDAAHADAISTAMMVMTRDELGRFFAANPEIGGLLAEGNGPEMRLSSWGRWR